MIENINTSGEHTIKLYYLTPKTGDDGTTIYEKKYNGICRQTINLYIDIKLDINATIKITSSFVAGRDCNLNIILRPEPSNSRPNGNNTYCGEIKLIFNCNVEKINLKVFGNFNLNKSNCLFLKTPSVINDENKPKELNPEICFRPDDINYIFDKNVEPIFKNKPLLKDSDNNNLINAIDSNIRHLIIENVLKNYKNNYFKYPQFELLKLTIEDDDISRQEKSTYFIQAAEIHGLPNFLNNLNLNVCILKNINIKSNILYMNNVVCESSTAEANDINLSFVNNLTLPSATNVKLNNSKLKLETSQKIFLNFIKPPFNFNLINGVYIKNLLNNEPNPQPTVELLSNNSYYYFDYNEIETNSNNIELSNQQHHPIIYFKNNKNNLIINNMYGKLIFDNDFLYKQTNNYVELYINNKKEINLPDVTHNGTISANNKFLVKNIKNPYESGFIILENVMFILLTDKLPELIFAPKLYDYDGLKLIKKFKLFQNVQTLDNVKLTLLNENFSKILEKTINKASTNAKKYNIHMLKLTFQKLTDPRTEINLN